MSNRLAITLLIYGMAQGVLFGFGLLAVLVTPLAAHAAIAIPAVVVLSAALAAPLAWKVAPIMRARHQKRLARQDKLGDALPA
ncbi:hypothetical protein [Henriciella aquimarina]|uniref:hypothetical protein n=1 Tax=Henriciella aquimarina TaxID=545261 RepID=UPI0009FE9E12|nr:hypothetical protein [Henriciella aquimarina]